MNHLTDDMNWIFIWMATNSSTTNRIKSFEYSELEKDFLYLGSNQTSKHLEGLRSLKISHIVNLAGRCHFPSEFVYGIFHIEDGVSESKREKNLPLIFEFIDRARNENPSNRVLIHCRAGISRTAFVAVAYLIHSRSICLNDAFNMVKQIRPQIRIHKEHWQFLLTFNTLSNSTVEQIGWMFCQLFDYISRSLVLFI